LMGASSLFAQSNIIIDELLAEEKATFGKTVYISLVAAGLIPEEKSVGESLQYLDTLGWKLKEKGTNDIIKLGEYSYLLMMAFDISGGIFYTLFPGPRYAVREFAYLGFVRRSPLAYRTLSGEEVIRILGKVLEWEKDRL